MPPIKVNLSKKTVPVNTTEPEPKKFYKVKTKDTMTARRQGDEEYGVAAGQGGHFSKGPKQRVFRANVTSVKEISAKKAVRLDAKANRMAGEMSGENETSDARYNKSVMERTSKATGGTVTSMAPYKAQRPSVDGTKRRRVTYVASTGGDVKRPEQIERIQGPGIKTPQLTTESTLEQVNSNQGNPGSERRQIKKPNPSTGKTTYVVKRRKPTTETKPATFKPGMPKFKGTFKASFK